MGPGPAFPHDAHAALLWAVVAVLGYVVGSVPVAVLAGRRAGLDPRTAGDRNAGFWNVKAHLGWRGAWPVLAGDTLKGVLAGLAGLLLVGGGFSGFSGFGSFGDAGGIGGAYAAVAGAMIGHAWPVFARFRGGKSVLTFVGGMIVIAPLAVALAVAVLAVVGGVTRSFARGAQVGIVVVPVAQAFLAPIVTVAWTGVLMTFIGLKFLVDRLARRHRNRARTSGRASAG